MNMSVVIQSMTFFVTTSTSLSGGQRNGWSDRVVLYDVWPSPRL